MIYFFTRRRLKRGTDRFSDNFGDVTRYIEVSDVTANGYRGKFLQAEAWAKGALAQSKNGEVLLYVHGFNTSQLDLVRRLQHLRAKLAFKGAIIGFDWPTESTNNPLKLFKVYQTAKTNLNKLDNILVTEGMNVIWEADKTMDFHVLAHSMGAYAVSFAFSHIEEKPGARGKNWKVQEAIFGAADLDARRMRKNGADALAMQFRSKRLTHFHSTVDDVLQMSGQIHEGHPRSGRVGLAPDLAKGFYDVSVEDRYRKKFKQHEKTTQLSHSWYQDDDLFLSDVDQILRGVPAASITTREPHSGGDQRLKP